MRKIKLLITITLLTLLVGCGKADDPNTIKIAATSVPHAEILEEAAKMLEEEYGYKLDIVVVQDYVTPNKMLQEKDIDANFFQHIPYLEQQIKDFGYDFTIAGSIHIEPMGAYSKKYDSIEDLPNEALVIFSNSVSDHGRILSLLEEEGLIKLDESVEKINATVEDIVENPKNLQFKADIDASLLPQVYNNNEGDLVIINTNYALDAGLNPLEDALILEGSASKYVNIVATRTEDIESAKIKALIEVLTSDVLKDFIINNYDGAVVPVGN